MRVQSGTSRETEAMQTTGDLQGRRSTGNQGGRMSEVRSVALNLTGRELIFLQKVTRQEYHFITDEEQEARLRLRDKLLEGFFDQNENRIVLNLTRDELLFLIKVARENYSFIVRSEKEARLALAARLHKTAEAVLLVVAADESVMPQTREHFHICQLLGIPRGLVALTKCDLADAETQALAEMEVRELLAGSFLEGAPVLKVSARTGHGLDGLRQCLLDMARQAAGRPADGLLRLPVDRVFSLRGFGTVVTGTLVSGRLESGEELEILPSGRRARVRGLQVHGRAVGWVAAGSR